MQPNQDASFPNRKEDTAYSSTSFYLLLSGTMLPSNQGAQPAPTRDYHAYKRRLLRTHLTACYLVHVALASLDLEERQKNETSQSPLSLGSSLLIQAAAVGYLRSSSQVPTHTYV